MRQLRSIEQEEIDRHDVYADKMGRMASRVERLELQVQAANHVADKLRVVAVEYEQKWQESVDGEARLMSDIARMEEEAAQTSADARTRALERVCRSAEARRAARDEQRAFAAWKLGKPSKVEPSVRRMGNAKRALRLGSFAGTNFPRPSSRADGSLRWQLATRERRVAESRQDEHRRRIELVLSSRARERSIRCEQTARYAFRVLQLNAQSTRMCNYVKERRAQDLIALIKRQKCISLIRKVLCAWRSLAASENRRFALSASIWSVGTSLSRVCATIAKWHCGASHAEMRLARSPRCDHAECDH